MIDLLAIVSGHSQNAHEFVVQLLEQHGSMAWFYQAFLLGDEQKLLAHSDWVRGFYITGLYHLLVVSGSHLSMLAHVVDLIFLPFKTKPPKWLLALVLFAFLFLNRFQAGAFRAFICSMLPARWPSLFKLFVSWTLLSFGFMGSPQLWSLVLSVAGVLGMELAQAFIPTGIFSTALARSLCCTLVSLPILLSLSSCISWLVVPVNTFLLPILEIFLLPAALLALAISPLRTIFEFLILKLGFFLDFLSSNFHNPQICIDTKGIISCFQFYLLALFCSLWFFQIRRRRWRWQSHFIKKSSL